MNETGPCQVADSSVVDLFCGVGGLSHGFFLENFRVSAGVDIDEQCRYPYERNNRAQFINQDVATLTAGELEALFGPTPTRILVGCAPCQPFSTYNQKRPGAEWRLLESFARLAAELLPEYVSMENVPRLKEFEGGRLFDSFVTTLEAAGYQVWHQVVYAPDFGVPQRRKRLVLLASRSKARLELASPTHDPSSHRTVRTAIGNLPSIRDGESDPSDAIHTSASLSDLNKRRIRGSVPGGTWRDWDPDLIAGCHRRSGGATYPSVYGRMEWDKTAPTITTQFYGFGNGRFGHPEQDRALSLREGAILQSFPQEYEFVEPGRPVHFKRLGRLIGNAVPVSLSRAIAKSIFNHMSAPSLDTANG